MSVYHRRRRSCTRRDPGAEPSDGLVNRAPDPVEFDGLWVMDVTEHPTAKGKVHLAIVLLQPPGGGVVDRRIRSELIVDAVQMAIWRPRPPEGPTVTHSDHGSRDGSRGMIPITHPSSGSGEAHRRCGLRSGFGAHLPRGQRRGGDVGSLRQHCGMDSPYLAVLSAEDRQEVLRAARRRRFARKEVIFHEGDPADTFHLLDRGHVGVRTTTPLGDVALLRVLGPGEAFGEMALIDPAPRKATIVALDACETLAFHRASFDGLRRDHPEVDRLLLNAMVVEVRRLSSQLLEMMYVPVEQRLYRRLVDLAKVYGAGDATIIPLTQDDLAQLTGTTRQTSNRILRAAEASGLLRVGRGRIELLDMEGLARRGR